MPELLKNFFNPDRTRQLATSLQNVWPDFPVAAFEATVRPGFDNLSLLQRGERLAEALRIHLPKDYNHAVEILLKSIGDPLPETKNNGMAPFFYLPHVIFVGRYGLNHLETSLRAQHALTQRFTAEFSIRGFLLRHPRGTVNRLKQWVKDTSPHVRRLVSEGTRPRLPWAQRLPPFIQDPRPVLELLEKLKDDPSLYVRRSVANNLNDIGKDHPELLVTVAKKWQRNASVDRGRLVRHALRSLIKKGHPGALSLLGFKNAAGVGVDFRRVSPPRLQQGGAVTLSATLKNTSGKPLCVLADWVVFYVKASGKTSPKVFKGGSIDLPPEGKFIFRKRLSTRDLTTRKHHPGRHSVDLQINGTRKSIGFFQLLKRSPNS